MTTSAPPTPNQTTDLMKQLRGGLQGFSERWLSRADELEDFLGRWGRPGTPTTSTSSKPS
jgi:hypothetical protein